MIKRVLITAFEALAKPLCALHLCVLLYNHSVMQISIGTEQHLHTNTNPLGLEAMPHRLHLLKYVGVPLGQVLQMVELAVNLLSVEQMSDWSGHMSHLGPAIDIAYSPSCKPCKRKR